MPIYEYRCASCEHEFEKIVRISDDNPVCPLCEASTEKKISLSAFHLKGGGWYADGYGSPAAAASASGPDSASGSSDSESSSGSSSSSESSGSSSSSESGGSSSSSESGGSSSSSKSSGSSSSSSSSSSVAD